MSDENWRNVIAKKLCFESDATRQALVMILSSFVPAVLVVFCVSFAMTDSALVAACKPEHFAPKARDLSPLLVYYIAWIAHMLLSISVGVGALFIRFGQTSIKRAFLKLGIPSIVIATVVVIVADAFHLKLAVLSHERLFDVLRQDPALASMFQPAVLRVTPFSFFPMVAIVAAFFATAAIILCASDCLTTFTGPHTGRSHDRISELTLALEQLRSHLLALSLVLVTSTLATIAYLRTPIGLLDATARGSFKAMSDAVGLVWGITFSLTLLALCVYPYVVLRKCFDGVATGNAGEKQPLVQWFRKQRGHMLVSSNLQVLLTTLLPATAAILANLVST
ncbi:MAG: hypothetical protein ACTHQM_06310 [Thermoanaerobaculia bacterium]